MLEREGERFVPGKTCAVVLSCNEKSNGKQADTKAAPMRPKRNARGLPEPFRTDARYNDDGGARNPRSRQSRLESTRESAMPCPNSDSVRRSLDGNSTVINRWGST